MARFDTVEELREHNAVVKGEVREDKDPIGGDHAVYIHAQAYGNCTLFNGIVESDGFHLGNVTALQATRSGDILKLNVAVSDEVLDR